MGDEVATTCCVVGGGPAGMMLGYLLARTGIDVIVLEKHRDFLRDFRGDTVHPSTLEVLHELGLLERFLTIPHSQITRLSATLEGNKVTVADFSRLRTQCPFIAMMPQWDFLDFVSKEATAFPSFGLRMGTEATGLLEDRGAVRGVRARCGESDLIVRAKVVVACDGRDSRLRAQSGLRLKNFGIAMDVLWFRLSRQDGDPGEAFGGVEAGQPFVLILRPEHWQCGFIIKKGAAEEVRSLGLDAFRARVASTVPFLANRMDEIASWGDVPALSVQVNRLRRWYQPGLLFIGDAAHAMSPMGGVGINLAIQDAVAAANVLTDRLQRNALRTSDLRRVQRRRSFPAEVTQLFQVILTNRGMKPILEGNMPKDVHRVARFLDRVPAFSRINGRMVGLGAQPEHVRTKAADPPAA